MEFPGILAKAHQARPERLPINWARSAKLGEHQVLLAANGAGWNRAASVMDAAVGFRPDAVISTGFCGGLEEDLKVGEIVVGTSVVKHEEGRLKISRQDGILPPGVRPTYPTRQSESPSGQGKHPRLRTRYGVVCSIDHVAQTSEEKSRLRSTGACAVEMEAAGVAERAQAMSLPFHCVKAITDLAGETMANDFNSALRSDGHFDTMLILRRSLRHPAVRVPELLRLRHRCVRAARALGDFFADCRF
jgi:adenosylhomocysteine nucleosidase